MGGIVSSGRRSSQIMPLRPSHAPIIPTAVTAVFLAAVPPAAGGPAEPRVPDLAPWPAVMSDYRISEEGGRRLLRFSSAILNVGDGPIEVRGRRRGDTMEAFQVLYAKRGRKQRIPIGEFEYHPEHFHWHLVEVAEYRLKDSLGVVLRASDKISFCLLDTNRVRRDLPRSPRQRRYLTCSSNRRARSLKAGVSVGWADVYRRNLPDQWVDVTGLPSGTYTLEVELDPGARLVEKTRDNNTASIEVAF
jgi:hypothetical protein